MSTPKWFVNFRGEKLGVSAHALIRFQERWSLVEKGKLSAPLKTLEELLEKAEDDTVDPVARTMSLLNNHCIPAIYLRTGLWRFVIVKHPNEEYPTLVTLKTIEEKKKRKRAVY